MTQFVISLPPEVSCIIGFLRESGYKAYAVGGCVRDSVMGLQPKDWDIATDAKPPAIKALFERTIDTGISHGTVTIVLNNKFYETTTFRIDGEYKDYRRPEEVYFTTALEEDLSRRDFTINAMAYSSEEGLIDPYDGVKDLNSRVIRCVGRPDIRFTEDALRMLRAVRFSAQLSFDIEAATIKAISDNCQLIRKISHERIRDELNKLMISASEYSLNALWQTGLLNQIIPELDMNYTTKASIAVSNADADLLIRWAVLLYPLEAATVHVVLSRLRQDKKLAALVFKLLQYSRIEIAPAAISVRKAVARIGKELFPSWLKVKKGKMLCGCEHENENSLLKLQIIEDIFNAILSEDHCTSLDELSVNGHDLIALGIMPGRALGHTLDKLLALVLEDPSLNTKSKLLQIIKEQ